MKELNEFEDYSHLVDEKKEFLDQTFRDSVATIDKHGQRKYIFPKRPSGKYYNWRTVT